jgi:hypothetical protein
MLKQHGEASARILCLRRVAQPRVGLENERPIPPLIRGRRAGAQIEQGRRPMERRRDTIAADGQFHSYEEWARLGPLPPFRSAVFIDARGRRCLTHRDFVRAREDGAFPVSYFWEATPETKPPGKS